MKVFLLLILLLPIYALAEPVKYADSFMIDSKAFGEEREVMISLPDTYESSSSSVYPVIYIVRGQLDMLSVIASLDMLSTEVPEFIVVGITGTGTEFHPTKTGEQSQFSQLVHDEVIPWTNEKYRTAPYSILIGHSNAGRFVMNDWFVRGTDFNDYYLISSSTGNKAEREFAISIKEEEVQKKGMLLVSLSNEKGGPRAMVDEFKGLDALSNNTTFIEFPNQSHMSGRIPTITAGLRQSFENWNAPESVQRGKFELLQAHYLKLSKQYGFEVEIPLETMKRMAGFDSMSDDEVKWENAANVVEYALTKNPNDVGEFFNIVDQVVDFGQVDASKRLISFICKNTPDHSRCMG
jgi:predicted alpha/beta superfamily hydrolase